MVQINTPKIHPRSLRYLSGHLRSLVRNRLWLQVLIGMFLGLLIGFLLGPSAGWMEPELGRSIGNWLALPGHLFLLLIQMIVVPLVFASVIRGLAGSEDPAQLKSLGLLTTLYFLVTTAIAAAIGLVAAWWIQPGARLSETLIEGVPAPETPAATGGANLDLGQLPQQVLGLLPSNPLNAMAEGEMLQVVIFAVIVGVALVSMAPKQAKPMLDLLGSLQEVCMTVVRWAMHLAPFAVFGLLAQLTSKTGLGALLGMLIYVATVLLGLLVLLALYLALLYAVRRMRPMQFLRSTREVLLLAFSTSSSAAVMPLSIRTAEEQLQVRPSISQFVIPLGATINMNGTALYQGVAALFLAQVYGIDLGMGSMALVVAMAVAASVGSPATPGVGIVILATVLTSVGVPASGVALIIGVDRILDMSRTTINVAGDLVASVLMERWVGGRQPVELALADQARRELIREHRGEDTLIGN